MPGGGGRGLGKGGVIRHRKILRDSIQGVTKPAIRRLARRGGVKRINGLVYEETRGVLRIFLEDVIRDAVTYTEHAKRKTVTGLDVVRSLKRQGRTIYGFDDSVAPRSAPPRKARAPALAAPAAAAIPDPDFKRDPELCIKYFKPGDEARFRLVNNKYLNDQVINAMVCQHTAGTGFYPMTSFFYDELSKGKLVHRYFKAKQSRFVPAGIKNLGDMKGLVVPINEHGNHWTVIIVDFERKSVVYYNSLTGDDSYLEDAVDLVMGYLEDESKGIVEPFKTPFHFDRSEWTVDYEDAPAQPNGIDCGVYATMWVRKYLKGTEFPVNPAAGRAQILAALKL